MTDLNKEREAFEEALGKHNIHNVHLCTVYDFKRNEYFPSDVCDPSEDRIVDSINLSWKMWQEKAKAQAVPETHLLVPKDKVRDLVAELEIAFEANLHLTISDLLPLQQDLKVILETSESGAEE